MVTNIFLERELFGEAGWKIVTSGGNTLQSALPPLAKIRAQTKKIRQLNCRQLSVK